MRVRDDPSWTVQQTLLREQGEVGRQFLTILVFWVDAAEEAMTDTEGSPVPFGPADALRYAWPRTEDEFGTLDFGYLGQMLLLISMFWVHGTEMVRTLTPIEMLLYRHGVLLKEEDLGKAAARTDLVPATPTQED